jgi:phosphoglycolate phosphatase
MQTVIFDFDGTIVDSLPGLVHMYEGVRGRGKVSPEGVRQLRNKSMYRIAREMGLSLWKVVYLALWGRRIFRKHLRSIHTFPGMPELIRELYEAKVKLFIVSTNRTANVRKYLEMHDLLPYFDSIYGGANFLNKARTLRKLMKREDLSSKDIWCVGDEGVDIRSARRAGLRITSVSWGYGGREGLKVLKPDKIVDSVDELRKALS